MHFYRKAAISKRLWCCLSRAYCTSNGPSSTSVGSYISCSGDVGPAAAVSCLSVEGDFVSSDEEEELMREVAMSFRRTKYEYAHWDGVITGFRETEKSQWKSKVSQSVIKRLQSAIINDRKDSAKVQPFVHVLDLAQDGYIGPHIDSIKFCGDAIAGISLLSDCVMRLTHKEQEKKCLTVLLPRYSLYIMSGDIRYNYSHEILPDSRSYFNNQHIPRTRRVSIICRTQPPLAV